MSLKVWVTGVDGTLKNLGLLLLPSPSYNSTSEVSVGKLGKAIQGRVCYHLSSDPCPSLWSIACWSEFTSGYSTNNNLILCLNTADANDSKFYLSIINNTTLVIGRGSARTVSYDLPGNFLVNTWYHLSATFDGTTTKLYLNGSLVNSSTGGSTTSALNLTIGGRSTNADGTGATGVGWATNDVRIYDHCLTPQEVKEISKGLVLHYKLDDEYTEPTINLASYSSTYDISTIVEGLTYNASGWDGDAGTVTYYKSGGYNNGPYKVYHKTAGGNGGIYKKLGHDIHIISGHTYTMSVYVKASRNFTDVTHAFSINRAAATQYSSGNRYITYDAQILFTTEWQRISRTFTASDADAGDYGEISIVYNDESNDFYIYYSCFQIEENDHATPYVQGYRNVEGTTNLIDYSNLRGLGSSWTLLSETFNGTPIYKNVVTSPDVNNNSGFAISKSITNSQLSSATKVTLSFYKRLNTVYGKNLGGYIRVVKSDDTEATYFWSYNKPNWANDANSIGIWDYITSTVTIPTGCKSIKYCYVYTDKATGGDCDFAQILLELKDHATLYTSGTRVLDAPIYDSSGYNNNGTITNGTMVNTSDTPRYNISTKNESLSNNVIITSNLKLEEGSITSSFWYKPINYTAGEDISKLYVKCGKFEFFTYVNYPYFTWNGAGKYQYTNYWSDGNWHFVTVTSDGTTGLLYIDGNLINATNGTSIPNYGNLEITMRGCSLSDFRIYTSVLTPENILDLYQEAAFIDYKGNIGCYLFYEDSENSKELWPTPTSNVTYNDDGSYTITGYKSAYSTHIPIDSSKTFYYDIEYSNLNAGNYFLIGFERYDIDKLTVTNQGCLYITTTKNAELHTRKVGTIAFSEVNGNPAAFTRLRILNHWSGSTSDSPSDSEAIIHYISLKEVSTITENQINKQGLVRSDLFIESENATISKYGTITGNQLIEI